MNKNTIIILVVGLIIGVGSTLSVSALINNDTGKQNVKTNQSTADHNSMTMTEMNKQLEGLSGDEFDKVFIEMMISHHEGAVDMANLSETRTKHDEIKTLSKDIVSAQTDEISKMQHWQMDWGYTIGGSSTHDSDH